LHWRTTRKRCARRCRLSLRFDAGSISNGTVTHQRILEPARCTHLCWWRLPRRQRCGRTDFAAGFIDDATSFTAVSSIRRPACCCRRRPPVLKAHESSVIVGCSTTVKGSRAWIIPPVAPQFFERSGSGRRLAPLHPNAEAVSNEVGEGRSV
jgi:hypothetical protein